MQPGKATVPVNDRRRMSAIDILQPARSLVILCQEQRCIHLFRRAVKQQPVHHGKRLPQTGGTRVEKGSQAGLQCGPYDRRCNSFPGHIANRKTEPMWAATEEIVVVSASLAS